MNIRASHWRKIIRIFTLNANYVEVRKHRNDIPRYISGKELGHRSSRLHDTRARDARNLNYILLLPFLALTRHSLLRRGVRFRRHYCTCVLRNFGKQRSLAFYTERAFSRNNSKARTRKRIRNECIRLDFAFVLGGRINPGDISVYDT